MVTARTRRGAWVIAVSGLFGGGCALPQGRTGGDPVLGNFNRPIAPTPSPFAGGYGSGSPAQDGGVRLGLPAPDVAAPSASTGSGGISARLAWGMPAPVSPSNLDYSNVKPPSAKGNAEKLFTPSYQRTDSVAGAKLVSTERPVAIVANPGVADYHPAASATAPRQTVPVNGLIAGASLPPEMQYNALRMIPAQAEAQRVQTVEEGELILAGYGLKWHNLQQTQTGEWQYSCIVTADGTGTEFRRYDARHPNPVEAVRAVVEQARRER